MIDSFCPDVLFMYLNFFLVIKSDRILYHGFIHALSDLDCYVKRGLCYEDCVSVHNFGVIGSFKVRLSTKFMFLLLIRDQYVDHLLHRFCPSFHSLGTQSVQRNL